LSLANASSTFIFCRPVRFIFHNLPSAFTLTGFVNPHCLNIIGNGVVVHIPSLFSELDKLESKGLSALVINWLHLPYP
jgi:adenylosuccinate synthase